FVVREADIGDAGRLEPRAPAAGLQPGLRLEGAEPPQSFVGERVEQRLLVRKMPIERGRAHPDVARQRTQPELARIALAEPLQARRNHRRAQVTMMIAARGLRGRIFYVDTVIFVRHHVSTVNIASRFRNPRIAAPPTSGLRRSAMASNVETLIRSAVTKGIGKVAGFNRKRLPRPVDAHPYLTGIHRPMEEEMTLEELRVEGKIPAALSGRYLRNGPNPALPPDPASYHWFTGAGMVHGIRI